MQVIHPVQINVSRVSTYGHLNASVIGGKERGPLHECVGNIINIPFLLLLCFGFVTAPFWTLLLGFVGAAAFGFGAAGFFAGTAGAGEMMGDFLRKTDGDGIWTSMRRLKGQQTWTSNTGLEEVGRGQASKVALEGCGVEEKLRW